MKTYTYCQSCGMPMKKDPKGSGDNADGSKNLKYCSYCYQKGAFTQPDFTADDMKVLVKDQLKKIGFPGFVAGYFAKGIPKLERWRTT